MFQSAVLSGDISMIWMVIDVYRRHKVVTNCIQLLFEQDFIGRSCIHYIANMPHHSNNNITIIIILDSILAHLDNYQPTHRNTMLSSRVNSLSMNRKSRSSSIYSTSISRISSISKLYSALENDDNNNGIDSSSGSSSSSGVDGSCIVIKEGWLTKKRTFGVFHRWVVLTTDRFMYYSSQSTPSSSSSPPSSTLSSPPSTTTTTTMMMMKKGENNRPLFVAPIIDCTFEQGMMGSQPTLIVRSSLIKTRRRAWRSVGGLGSKSDRSSSSSSGSSSDTMVFTTAEGSSSSSSSSSHDLRGWVEVLQGLSIVRSIPMNFINVDLRRLWVNMLDHNSDTALHVLVRRDVLASSSSSVSSSYTSSAIKYAYWLIENGCPVDATNKLGMTAMHLCVIMFFYYASSSYSNSISSSSSTESWFDYLRSLILCLLTRGDADVMNIRNNHGLSVLDLLRDDLPYVNNENVLKYGIELEALLLSNYRGRGDAPQSSKRPERCIVKMLGYSYLSFYFKEG